MSALICGSVAYDNIMVFEDSFKNHILPDKIHILNVAFLVPKLRREFGGCATNIAYNVATRTADTARMISFSYGTAACMRCCARMIREEAMSSCARVILAMDRTVLIRRRSSLSWAPMGYFFSGCGRTCRTIFSCPTSPASSASTG